MNDNSFKMCIDCANKQSRTNMAKGMYYCPIVKDVLKQHVDGTEVTAVDCEIEENNVYPTVYFSTLNREKSLAISCHSRGCTFRSLFYC